MPWLRLPQALLAMSLLSSGIFPAAAQEAPGQLAGAPASATWEGPPIVVTGEREARTGSVAGLSMSTLDGALLRHAPAFSVGSLLQSLPGVAVQQNNGPRDAAISLRGSNARATFGIRNIVLFEDGFPVTQPDGLSRSDLTDPHAYDGIELFRGPSSAQFGNYATGGAIRFFTRAGRDIDGAEAGFDAGSFGYRNAYGTVGGAMGGGAAGALEGSLFASRVRGDGFLGHSAYRTHTVNGLLRAGLSEADTLVLKLIDNVLHAETPLRLTLNQFGLNPYQQGCERVAGAAAGCASVSLFANGRNGTRVPVSADEAGVGRHDRRTIAGLRWEHAFDAATMLRLQGVFDNKDIDQPTGATSAVGPQPSFNLTADLSNEGSLFGLPARHAAGLFYNRVRVNSRTWNVMPKSDPGGSATLGALVSDSRGHHANWGGRLREDLDLAPDWTLVLGIGMERTRLSARQIAYTYPIGGETAAATTPADRCFLNVAPEAALRFRPDQAWTLRARVSTGYGTPQAGNLFVTPSGLPGNNAALKTQRNVGFELGADWQAEATLRVGASAFQEFFRNELVTQSPGANLLNFTFNAPRSEHRGIELDGEWRPLPEWRLAAAWSLNDQRYRGYQERLSAGTASALFDRADNRIPGVVPQTFYGRFGYERAGEAVSWGAYVEFRWADSFFLDNGNLLKAPSYRLVNLNLHADLGDTVAILRGLHLFLQVDNLLDRIYAASAGVIADQLNAATGQQNPASVLAGSGASFYAGSRRAVTGGMRIRL